VKTENKWSDFNYRTPEPLSKDCIDTLLAIQGEKDSVNLYKDWNFKFKKEIEPYRETTLGNVSNFAFMTTYMGSEKWPAARKVLESYLGMPGFFHLEGKWICNHRKALAFIESKSFLEVEAQPVYGGAYE